MVLGISWPLLPKIILPHFVTAGQSVHIASPESTNKFIPAEGHAVMPVHAAWAPYVATDFSRAHGIRPDFSHIHCKAFSGLLSHAKPEHGTHHQRRRKGESTSIPGLSAQCELWGLRLPAASTASSWDGRCGDITRVPGGACSPSSRLHTVFSHIPSGLLVMVAVTAELPAWLSSPLAEEKEAAGHGLISSHSWAAAYSGSA